MMWLVLFVAQIRHQKLFIQQSNCSHLWDGIVKWVTPWVVCLKISYEDPDSVHTLIIPVSMIESVRDFSPDAARNAIKIAFREDPPDPSGVIH